MSGVRRRLERLEEGTRPSEATEDEQAREEQRRSIREEAEHVNRCGWGREYGGWPLFRIEEGGDVSCTHDGKPVTDTRQILAEHFYWMEVAWGGFELTHDEEAQAFYAPDGGSPSPATWWTSGASWAR